jgi:hypothetical protein
MKITLADGSPVPDDESHREIDPKTGMQRGYIVLSDEERKKGFVRPLRRTYIHLKCKTETRMNDAIAETYARDPNFYDGTYCSQCRAHFPIGEDGEFVWKDNPEQKVGT